MTPVPMPDWLLEGRLALARLLAAGGNPDDLRRYALSCTLLERSFFREWLRDSPQEALAQFLLEAIEDLDRAMAPEIERLFPDGPPPADES